MNPFISPKLCLSLGFPFSCEGMVVRDFQRQIKEVLQVTLKMNRVCQSENVIKVRFVLIETSC